MSLEFENCEFSFYSEEEIKKLSVIEVTASSKFNTTKTNTIGDLKMGSSFKEEK